MTFLIVTGILTGIIMCIYYIKSKNPVKNAFKGMLSGAVAFLIVCYFGHYININLPLSFFNTGVSLILGVPGVILMIVGKFILV